SKLSERALKPAKATTDSPRGSGPTKKIACRRERYGGILACRDDGTSHSSGAWLAPRARGAGGRQDPSPGRHAAVSATAPGRFGAGAHPRSARRDDAERAGRRYRHAHGAGDRWSELKGSLPAWAHRSSCDAVRAGSNGEHFHRARRG